MGIFDWLRGDDYRGGIPKRKLLKLAQENPELFKQGDIHTLEGTGPYGEFLKGKASLLGHRVEAVRTGITLWTILKPILIGLVIIIFVLGAGLPAISAIFQSMTWYLWVGLIVLGLIIWNNL